MRFNRILIAIDESPIAASALEAGAALADSVGAEIALVNVVDSRTLVAPDGGISPDELRASWERDGRKLLAAAAARLRDPKPPWEFVVTGNPAEQIVATACQWRADVIVVGTHAHRGISRILLGSTAEGVLRHAPCPVLVVPPARGEPATT